MLGLLLWSSVVTAQGDWQVRQAQERLQAAGFDPGPMDGALGARTKTALRQYQAHHGLLVTGVLDEATRKLLIPEQAQTLGSTQPSSTTPVVQPTPPPPTQVKPSIDIMSISIIGCMALAYLFWGRQIGLWGLRNSLTRPTADGLAGIGLMVTAMLGSRFVSPEARPWMGYVFFLLPAAMIFYRVMRPYIIRR